MHSWANRWKKKRVANRIFRRSRENFGGFSSKMHPTGCQKGFPTGSTVLTGLRTGSNSLIGSNGDSNEAVAVMIWREHVVVLINVFQDRLSCCVSDSACWVFNSVSLIHVFHHVVRLGFQLRFLNNVWVWVQGGMWCDIPGAAACA